MSGAHRFRLDHRVRGSLPPQALDTELRAFPAGWRSSRVIRLARLPGGFLSCPGPAHRTFVNYPSRPADSSWPWCVACRDGSFQRFEGQVFAFEHGALHPCERDRSRGVDQAGLRLVPLPFDLLDAAARDARAQGMPFLPLGGAFDPWRRIPAQGDCLLIQRQHDQAAALILPESLISQWFRKIIAAELRRPTEWDCREKPHFDNMLRTAVTLR